MASGMVNRSTKGHKLSPWVFFITRIRTWCDSRPMTAQTGGRSFSYVPRPPRLFARTRGGSCGSPCHFPFFPSVLEHFVGFDFQIVQRFGRLLLFSVGLQQVAHCQHRRPADFQLSAQFRSRFSLQHFTDEHNCLLWREGSPFKHRAAIQVVNATTNLAPIDIQVASFRLSKLNRLVETRLTMRTFQPARMEVFFQPFYTCLTIH